MSRYGQQVAVRFDPEDLVKLDELVKAKTTKAHRYEVWHPKRSGLTRSGVLVDLVREAFDAELARQTKDLEAKRQTKPPADSSDKRAAARSSTNGVDAVVRQPSSRGGRS